MDNSVGCSYGYRYRCLALVGNSALQMHHINIANKKIPTSFQGYRIVHLSDLHNAQFGE